MTFKPGKQTSIDDLLKDLTNDGVTLKELYDLRLEELDLTLTTSAEILDISYRALKGILTSTQKNVDITNLIKIADFLKRDKQEVIDLYLRGLEVNFEVSGKIEPEKAKFIKDNFDLAALKKVGFINSINDFSEIESKLTTFLGIKSISEYTPPSYNVAFSESKVKPKDNLNRNLWIYTARQIFTEIGNPNEFNREGLIQYFPEIRWHTTSVEFGLLNVIRSLYQLGVTVAFLPTLPSLNLRGATFSVNRKPCIIITDFRGFYATLWFTLIHELFHVIFDWQEIKTNRYHLSLEDSDQLSVIDREREADAFARSYLFSNEKLQVAKYSINNKEYIERYAQANHVHPSIIYAFNAHKEDSSPAWAIAQRENPNTSSLLKHLDNHWDKPIPIREYVNKVKNKFYN